MSNTNDRKLGFVTSMFTVIANMIGTGLFTSLGFQALGVHSQSAILLLWIVGGLIALCGTLVYAELGVRFPRSGGEYNILSEVYHPVVGFLSGWLSITIGFAAPVALAAVALGNYSAQVFDVNPLIIAAVVVLILTLIHSWHVVGGAMMQNIFVFGKISLILILVFAGLNYHPHQSFSFFPVGADWSSVWSNDFAVSLVYVSYAYSGWNASIYFVNEIRKPYKNVFRSLFFGTLLVMILYVALNYVFLRVMSIDEIIGYTNPTGDFKNLNPDIAFPVALKIFGTSGGQLMALCISLILVSSVSSMIFVGPRVTQIIGEDYSLFKFASGKNKNGAPTIAVVLQSAITLILIFTSSFEAILKYAGFVLALSTCLTVGGLFIVRLRKLGKADSYKTFLYPFTPIFFLALNGWMLFYLMKSNPYESLAGFITLLSGGVVYAFAGRKKKDDASLPA